jgi:O-antigen ligase/polysaccharide polymerase Wzy-like membrane protein
VRLIRGDEESLAERSVVSGRGRIEGFAFLLLVTWLALAPFPYGAILPGASLILEICAFAIAVLALLTRPATHRFGAGAIPVVAIAAVAAIGLLQLIPMSIDGLRRISPASAQAYADANAILRMFGRNPATPRISIAPSDTISTVLQALAYCAILTASMILVSTRFRRRILTGALLTSMVVHLVIAAVTNPSDRLHGTFINPDHMAGYLEIGLAFAFGVIWAEVLTNPERVKRIHDRAERFERRFIPLVWRILVWAVIAAGIVLTRSRGGLLAAAVSTAILLLMALTRLQTGSMERRQRIRVLGAVAFSLGLLLVIFTTGQAAILRFLASDPRDIGTDTRVEIWRGSVRAFHLFPNSGSGLGTFREAFRRVQTPGIVGLVEQAHNDFLQLLVTAGWAGAALGAIAFGSMLILLLGGGMRQQHREESAFILAGFGALLCLTLHGIVEFNMSIPAIPATLAAMVGSAWSATQTG